MGSYHLWWGASDISEVTDMSHLWSLWPVFATCHILIVLLLDHKMASFIVPNSDGMVNQTSWSAFLNHVRCSGSPESHSVGTKAHSKLSVMFSVLKRVRVFKRVFYNESQRAYTCLMLASLPVFSSLIMLSLALKSGIESRPLQRCFSPLECSIEEEDSI